MRDRRKIGKIGEDMAINFLECLGFQMMEKNYRSGRGEIDIIAIRQGLLLFVEVKTHSSHCWYGAPEDKVRWYQQQKIMDTAQRYLCNCSWEGQIRFDVIVVYLDGSEIRYFPGYFGQL